MDHVSTEGHSCTLDHEALEARLADWRAVMAEAIDRDRTEPGVTVAHYPNELALRGRLEALIAAEATCCSFLRFALAEDGGVLRLTLHHPPEFSLPAAR